MSNPKKKSGVINKTISAWAVFTFIWWVVGSQTDKEATLFKILKAQWDLIKKLRIW